jgi:hypothetical protein
MTTVFNIKGELNPGTWFYYDEEDEDSGRVLLRTSNAKTLESIYKRTRKDAVDYRTIGGLAQRFEYQKITKPDLENELLWDYCIMDWEGFKDADGNAIECTKENKVLLMNNSAEFLRFIGRSQTALRKIEVKYDEEEEKNLLTT